MRPVRPRHPSADRRPVAASVNRVRTSQATSSSTARRRAGARMARIAPKPPSVVADPPRPTMIRLAPASSAASISSPVPVVLAAIGSLPSAPPASTRPDASAISITAVRPVIRQSASTGSPSGPVTIVCRVGPPNASSHPSPPSETGAGSHSWPSRSAAAAIVSATSRAVAVPLNLSTAASTRTSAQATGGSPAPKPVL